MATQEQTKVYFTDGGDKLVVANGGTIELESGATFSGDAGTFDLNGLTVETGETLQLDSGAVFTIDGAAVPASVAISAASAAANVCEVTFQVQNLAGASLAGVFDLVIWLSDAATGAGLTATSASGTVQAKSAAGADLGALTAKKALHVQTLADGSYTLEITDTAKTAFYPCVSNPLTRAAIVGTVLATGDYGS